MDARTNRIATGVVGIGGLLIAAALAPAFAGALLMFFSLLVFVGAVAGLAWPSLIRLPNRLAAVWVFAVSIGLFIGGGMLLSPTNGESTAADAPTTTEPAESPRIALSNAVRVDTWTDGPWPLTIDGGLLTCVRIRTQVAVFLADGEGRMWPLNGIANAHHAAVGAEPSLDPIWQFNPEIPGGVVRIDIGRLIDRALAIC